MTQRILCFGDSNTYGYSPLGERYDESTRWPMALQKLLGEHYTVIEEGLGGRTTVMDDAMEGGHRSGLSYLPPCLMSHNPLDLVIIMLGTNDAKQRFSMNAYNIAQGMLQLVKAVNIYGQGRELKPPKTLVVAPPLIGADVSATIMGPIFGEQAHLTSLGFAEEYRKMALLTGSEYLNAATYVQPSKLDAVHLTKDGQLALAEAIFGKVVSII